MRYKLVIFWSVWGDFSIGQPSKLNQYDYNNFLFEFNEDNIVDITQREPGNILYDVPVGNQELTFIKMTDTNIYKVDDQRNENLDNDSFQYYVRVIEERDPLFNAEILLEGMGSAKLDHTSTSKTKAAVFSRILQAYLN